jgi:hypothetical protein
MLPVFDIAHQAVAVIPLAGEGILDLLTSKNSAVQTFLRALTVTLGIIFVIYQAVVSRGALARILISALAAALFIWIVFNVTALQTRVDNEVNADGGPLTVQLVQGSRDATQPV